MKKLVVALVLLGFVTAGAAANHSATLPERPGKSVQLNSSPDSSEVSKKLRRSADSSVNDSRTGKRGAQFDARMMTAIKTLEVLADIAPSENASESINEAISILENVQEGTDTESLGSQDNRTEEVDEVVEANMTEDNLTDLNSSENVSEMTEESVESEGSEDTRSNRGRGNGRPGFVRNLLGSLFG